MGETEYILENENWGSRSGGKMLIYSGPHIQENVTVDSIKQVVRNKKALGAIWSYDWDNGIVGSWYSYICDTVGYNLDKIESANTRSKIRRSLKRSETKKVSLEFLAKNSYDTYKNAAKRYNQHSVTSREAFCDSMNNYAKRKDVEAYGTFIEDKLVAYGIAFIKGNSIRLGPTKFDPAYSSAYPMYGLYYTMVCDYMELGCYDCVDNGARALHHETNIGDFLLKMGWRKAQCRLGLYLTPTLRAVLFISKIFKHLLRLFLPARYYSMLLGLFMACEIANET
ncbi:GNAT family N-acetyltransferase, partial [Candidatus Pacearchaeota archaeon]|nr:GNAT family N-acetyltransferase [Candidatus Pacearchaeota archaeon]